MGNSFGQTRTLFTEQYGRSIQVNADGHPKWKTGGITVDWPSIPACPANGGTYYGATVADGQVTFEDGVVVKVGEKAIRYGACVVYDAALDTASVVDGDPNGAYRLALAGDTLVRGGTFLVNETVLEEDTNSNNMGVMVGGTMFRDRIVASASATNNLYDGTADAPSIAQIEGAMPLVSWALDN